MISPFLITNSVFESSHLTKPENGVLHDFLIRTWRDYGVFVLPNDETHSTLDLIKKLPVKYQQKWASAFEYYKKHRVHEINSPEIESISTFESACELADFIKVLLVNNEESPSIFENNTTYKYCSKNDFEAILYTMASESKHFCNSEREAKSEIIKSEDIRSIWNRKFHSLAQYSTSIVIIDRYFFSNTISQNSKINSAISNLLILLSRYNKKFKIRIVSCGKDDLTDRPLIIERMKKAFNGTSLAKNETSFTLIAKSEDFFQNDAHDRFITFDSHVCQIGVGMMIFSNYPCPQTTFSMIHESFSEFKQRNNLSSINQLWFEVLSSK